MRKKIFWAKFWTVTMTILIAIVSFVFAPVITFACAYIGGMILDWVVGEKLIEGLNLIFDTTRFTRELIPLTCATLATIGRYFKANQTNNKDKE